MKKYLYLLLVLFCLPVLMGAMSQSITDREFEKFSDSADGTAIRCKLSSDSVIPVDTTNFDTNLSSADDTVQKALDTLDDAAGGGAGDLKADGTVPLTADWPLGAFKLSADSQALKPSYSFSIAGDGARGGRTADYFVDGTADDVQFNAAVDAMEALSSATELFSKLYVAPTTYVLADAIQFTEGGYIIEGEGIGSKIMQANSADSNIFEFNKATADTQGLVFEKLFLFGNRDNNTSGNGFYDGVGEDEVSDVHFFHTFIFDMPENGIKIDDAWGFSAIETIVEECDGSGLEINGGMDGQIISSKFDENELGGIEINGGSNMKVISNIATPSATNPAYFLNSTVSQVIANQCKDDSIYASGVCFMNSNVMNTFAFNNGVAENNMTYGFDSDDGGDYAYYFMNNFNLDTYGAGGTKYDLTSIDTTTGTIILDRIDDNSVGDFWYRSKDVPFKIGDGTNSLAIDPATDTITITGMTTNIPITKCVYWENPVATDDFKSVFYFEKAATITRLRCESDQTVTMTIQEDDGSPADIETTDLVCDATPADQTTGFEDASMAAGSTIDFAVESVSGTPTWGSFCFSYTQ